MSELYDFRKRLELFFILGLVVIVIGYGAFRAYPLLIGPTITVTTPTDGDYVATSTFEISGTVTRATKITLQGRPITIDDQGHFTETLVASPPYTILVLVATDKYGATETKTLRVVPHE